MTTVVGMVVQTLHMCYNIPIYIIPILKNKCIDHEWPLKNIWALQGRFGIPFMQTSATVSQISDRFALRPTNFPVTGHLKTIKSPPNNSNMSLNTTKQKVPHICSTCESQMPISSYMPFWVKCTEWPPNDLEHYKINSTQYIFSSTSISISLAL